MPGAGVRLPVLHALGVELVVLPDGSHGTIFLQRLFHLLKAVDAAHEQGHNARGEMVSDWTIFFDAYVAAMIVKDLSKD